MTRKFWILRKSFAPNKAKEGAHIQICTEPKNEIRLLLENKLAKIHFCT